MKVGRKENRRGKKRLLERRREEKTRRSEKRRQRWLLTEGEVMSGGVDMSPKISSWLMFWEGDEIRGQPVRRSVKWNNVAFDTVTVTLPTPPPHTSRIPEQHASHTACGTARGVSTRHLPERCCGGRRRGGRGDREWVGRYGGGRKGGGG